MVDPYANVLRQDVNIFGQPMGMVAVNVREYMRQHPRQMQGLPLEQQLKLAIAAIYGAGIATQYAVTHLLSWVQHHSKRLRSNDEEVRPHEEKYVRVSVDADGKSFFNLL